MLSRSCSLLVLFSPLHAAAFGGYQEVVETFLEKNVRWAQMAWGPRISRPSNPAIAVASYFP